MIKRFMMFAAALLCTAMQVSAQDAVTVERLTRDSLRALLGTMSVEARPNFAGGQLNGCTIEFNVMAQDSAYKQGAYIKVGGSFGFMSARGNIAAVLKVLVNDVDTRTMTLTPSAPASAYFVAGTTTTKNAIVSSYPSDAPGAIFVVFKLQPTFEFIARGLHENKVTIGFARKKGGVDILVPIDTSVVDTTANGRRTYSPKVSLDFLKCSESLIQQAIK